MSNMTGTVTNSDSSTETVTESDSSTELVINPYPATGTVTIAQTPLIPQKRANPLAVRRIRDRISHAPAPAGRGRGAVGREAEAEGEAEREFHGAVEGVGGGAV